jgi:hypothetical protein
MNLTCLASLGTLSMNREGKIQSPLPIYGEGLGEGW